MSGVRVITNNVPRDILHWQELTDSERAEFDYVDTDKRRDNFRAFRYQGEVYDLGEFVSTWSDQTLSNNTPDVFDGWDGYHSDSFFSGGMVVRYVDRFEMVVVGRYTLASE